MQLTYPWFLLSLVAIAIPIIIHLLQLRRPQRLTFTNIAFIRTVEIVTVRHRKVQHLLILLARIVAVTALVIAFCQPFIPAKLNQPLSGGTGIDVLVDHTFSMQLRGNTQNSLGVEAVAAARELGQTSPAGSRFRLITDNNRSTSLLTPAGYQAKLDEVKLSARRFSNPTAVNNEQDTGRNPLYIFSDFQKNGFNAKILQGLAVSREVVLVPLVGEPAANVFVDSLWLDEAFVRVRTNVGLRVRLRNGGQAIAKDCPVKVFLGARQVAAFRLTVGIGQTVTSTVQVQVSDASLALGRVVTEDAPVIFDNTYYFTLQPATTVRVLEIGSEPVAQQLYGDEPLFTYSFARPRQVDYSQLRQANLVLIREVSEVDPGLRAGLRAVLQRGGSVVIVPSALPMAQASYQQLFRELGLGAVQWEPKVTTPELREVAMPNIQEPFFQGVFGAQRRTVTLPRAAPVLRWARTGTDILRLRTGESYLAGFSSGPGQVYVFSAPLAREYSDFTAHALFVPVMYRMAMLSYRNEQQPAYRLTQGTVRLKLPLAVNSTAGRPAGEAGIRLVQDSLTLIPVQRTLGAEVRLELPADLSTPGFYRVQRGGNVLTTVAFNPDKRESELSAYSAGELRQMAGSNQANIRVLEGGSAGLNLTKFRAAQTGQPLWRYFLLLALAGLLIEGLLLRFGDRTARVRKVEIGG